MYEGDREPAFMELCWRVILYTEPKSIHSIYSSYFSFSDPQGINLKLFPHFCLKVQNYHVASLVGGRIAIKKPIYLFT
jgi:hypothetical protein